MSRARSPAQHRGFTLTELILVIIITGLAGAAMMSLLPNMFPRAPTPAQITLADQLALERMELILGTRQTRGFASIVDPCASGTPAPCAAVAGYTVTANGVPSGVTSPLAWAVDGNTTHFRVVTVTVTGPSGTQLSSLTAVLGNY